MLPDAVQQGLGWQPQPLQPLPDYGGLPPEVAQAIGLAQPPAPPVADLAPPPPIPQQLPSAAEQPAPEPAAPQQPTRPDYAAPAPAAPPPVAPPKPVKPPTPDQQLANVQQRQAQADQASMSAIRDQEAVSRAKAADDLAAYQQHDAQAKAIEAQRKAQADEYAKVHATKQAYVDSTLRDVDNYKVDQNKYWKEAGVGDHIGWYVAMALSSFGDALQRKSGPNPIVQMLQDKMHQSVVAQMDEREQLKQRNVRAEHALDKYDAFSQSRDAQIALLDSRNDRALANQLMTAAAKYADPMAVARAQKEAADLMQSSTAKAEQAAQFAAGFSVQKGQLGVAQFNAQEGQRHNLATEALTAQQRDIEAAKALKAGMGDQAKLIRERALGGDVVEVKNPDGTVTKKTDLIRLKNGDVFIPQGTETNVTKLQEQHKASMQLLGTIDEIMRLGPEWLSDTTKSEKKQRLDELMGAARLQAIAANNLGVPTGKDVELATAVIGTNDPTQVRNTLAGLQQGRATIIRNHNIELKAFGLDRTWEPEDNSKPLPSPAQTDPDKLLKVALGSSKDDPGSVVDPQTGALQPKIPGMYRVDPDASPVVKPTAEDVKIERNYPKMGPGQRAVLDVFASWARGDDPALRKKGFDLLEKSAKDGDEQGVRDYAQQLLTNTTTTQPTFTEPTTTSSGPGRTSGGRSFVEPTPSLTPQVPASSSRGH